MKSKFLIFFLLIATGTLSAKDTRIWGVARMYKGSSVVAFTEGDFISNKRQVLGIGKIDEAGNFDFSFDLDVTREVKLSIGSIEAILYAYPGETYHVAFPAYIPPSGIKKFDRTEVELQFFDIQMNDANVQLRSFNLDYAQFVNDHYYDFAIERYRGSEAVKVNRAGGTDMTKKDTKIQYATIGSGGPVTSNEGNWGSTVADFVKYSYETYRKYMDENEFIHNYIRYQLAELELTAGYSRRDIYREYIFSRPVLYTNPAYIDFFQLFHSHLFEDELNGPRKNDMLVAINGSKDWRTLSRMFEKDSMLTVEPVRLLALISNLRDVYHHRDFRKASIEELLKRMSTELPNATLAAIAGNVREELMKCTAGWQAEDAEMFDIRKQPWNLSSLRGKYVYIGFYADWCTSCLKEMQLMEKLYATYGKNIEFVSISMDETWEDFTKYVQRNRSQNWIFAYGTHDPLIKEKFKLRSLPAFVMLDPEGKFMFDVTRKPTEGIQNEFEKLKNTLTKGGQQPGTWKN